MRVHQSSLISVDSVEGKFQAFLTFEMNWIGHVLIHMKTAKKT